MNEMSESQKEISRRDFLVKVSLGLAGLSAVIAAVPIVSALIAPLLENPPPQWRTVGKSGSFAIGSTNLVTFINSDPKPYAGTTAHTAAWLRRQDEHHFIAFSVNCTHLGCPVRWEKDAELFMCPCHGGVYYADGSVAAGPPPKPLNQYKVRIYGEDVQIQTAPIPLTGVTKPHNV